MTELHDASFDDFVCALLEPVGDGLKPDTNYNTLMRRARQKEWRKREAEFLYHEAHLSFVRAERRFRHECQGEPLPCGGEDAAVLVQLRQARDNLLRTPAGRQTDVSWKRSELRRWSPYGHPKISKAEIEALIDADVKWLDAHPTTVRSRRKRGQK